MIADQVGVAGQVDRATLAVIGDDAVLETADQEVCDSAGIA